MSGPQPGTPTPWRVEQQPGDEWWFGGKNGCQWVIYSGEHSYNSHAVLGGEYDDTQGEQDAAAIVHRVNNWDTLVEALDFMVNVSRSVSGFSPMAREQAEKALAKARGEA